MRMMMAVLMLAACAYEVGEGRNLKWTPDPLIVDALDDAFQYALSVAEPTGKRIMVGIDSSGSMHRDSANGIPLFKIAAAMALVEASLPHLILTRHRMRNGDFPGITRRQWWEVKRYGPNQLRPGGFDDVSNMWADGETAAHAITRAYIAAMKEKDHG